ncbi:ATP-binding protein [Photobacterium leiognathi]|nr:ATP-binding protein [Photobacterium leiognathi]
MNNTYYALFDDMGKIITSTLDESIIKNLQTKSDLSGSIKCDNSNTNYKYLIVENGKGKCFAITNEKDFIKSRRVYEKHLLMLIDTIKTIKELSEQANLELKLSTHRLIHNLTSINAHNIQEIYGEFPQSLISTSGKKNITVISDIITQKPKTIAKMVLRLAKNNVAMKAEFSVFKRLFDNNVDLSMNYHKVHKVLMNILYTFFPDFTSKHVNVIVHDSSEMAYLDYETFHVAMFHILDNAAKYTKPNSQFDIHINKDEMYITINFEMDSLVIEDDEIEHIFQEGYSGKYAHCLFKNGQGIGMARIKEMLNLNKGDISIEKIGAIQTVNTCGLEVKYQRNIFKLRFLAKKPNTCCTNSN